MRINGGNLASTQVALLQKAKPAYIERRGKEQML